MVCFSGAGLSLPLLSGCQSTYYSERYVIEPNGISILKSEFTYLKKDQPGGQTGVYHCEK